MFSRQSLTILGVLAAFAVLDARARQGRGNVHEPVVEGFVMKDNHGKVRARLSVTVDDHCRLALCSADGHERLTLSVDADGTPAVELLDKNRRARIGMRLQSDGSPYTYMHDADGVARIQASCEEESGIANITLYNRKEEIRVGISAFPSGQAHLAFPVGKKGEKAGLAFGIRDDGTPTAEVYDANVNNKSRVRLGQIPGGALGIVVSNEENNASVQIGLTPDGDPIMKFFDATGKNLAPRLRE